jgi:hypothetical protein
MIGEYHNSVIHFAITPTLNTLNNAKQPYSNPTGYATSNLWSDIRSTVTNIPEAAYVHHKIDTMERIYPSVPLEGEPQR